jgi:cleavage and polyadenylation specificity factor subunit 1
VYKNVVLITIP